MRTRLLLIAALAASISGLAAAPASASCYPQKPQTCSTCRITDVAISEEGVRLVYECP